MIVLSPEMYRYCCTCTKITGKFLNIKNKKGTKIFPVEKKSVKRWKTVLKNNLKIGEKNIQRNLCYTHRLNIEFIWAPVYSCTHWLRPRNSPLPPHLGLYTRALLVSQDRTTSLCDPWIYIIRKLYRRMVQCISFSRRSLQLSSRKSEA